MKRIYLIIFTLTYFTGNAISQNPNKIGLEIGPSLSNLRGDRFNEENNSLFKLYAAATFEYSLNNRFSLKSGLTYETKGGKYEFFETNPVTDEFLKIEINNQLSYLTIPILFKYSTKGDVQFFANTGPFFSLLMSSKGIASKKTDYGITSGLGLQFFLNNNYFALELRNSLGLQNIQNSRFDSSSNVKTNAFYLLVSFSRALL